MLVFCIFACFHFFPLGLFHNNFRSFFVKVYITVIELLLWWDFGFEIEQNGFFPRF